MCKLISTKNNNKKVQVGNEWLNILSKSSQVRKKPPPPFTVLVHKTCVSLAFPVHQQHAVLNQSFDFQTLKANLMGNLRATLFYRCCVSSDISMKSNSGKGRHHVQYNHSALVLWGCVKCPVYVKSTYFLWNSKPEISVILCKINCELVQLRWR